MSQRLKVVASTVALLAPLGVLVFATACSEATLAGVGGECFQVTDCQPGLVCAPERGGRRTCTDDLSRIERTGEMGGGEGEEDGGPDDDAEPGEPRPDGGTNEGGTPPRDVNNPPMPDTSVPDSDPPPDADPP